jgi:hypothetical protein
MNARDELARIVDEVRDDPARRDMSRIIEREQSMARFQGFGEWDQARLVAHNLHAAGYRKPRTVTTAEELDALPIKSLVLALDGEVWQRIKGGWGLGPDDYPEMSETVLWQSSEGPSATVLWEPKP